MTLTTESRANLIVVSRKNDFLLGRTHAAGRSLYPRPLSLVLAGVESAVCAAASADIFVEVRNASGYLRAVMSCAHIDGVEISKVCRSRSTNLLTMLDNSLFHHF